MNNQRQGLSPGASPPAAEIATRPAKLFRAGLAAIFAMGLAACAQSNDGSGGLLVPGQGAGSSPLHSLLTGVVSNTPAAGWLLVSADNWGPNRMFRETAGEHANVPALAGGNHTLEIYFKQVSENFDWSTVRINVRAAGTEKEVELLPYGTPTHDWTQISIPIADFNFAGWHLDTGINVVGPRIRGSAGADALFGIDEIRFVGGATPFVWYGDSYTLSGEPAAVHAPGGSQIVDRLTSGGVDVPDYVDTMPPVINLAGENPLTIEQGNAFVEPGFTALDNVDGDLTALVAVNGTVDVNTVGSYVLNYSVSDTAGNTGFANRTVNVTMAGATENVTLGKAAVAELTDGANVASRATDGDLSTFWASPWHSKAGLFLDVDLNGSFDVHSARLHLSNSPTSSRALSDFDLEYWDGGCWKPIPGAQVRGNPSSNQIVDLAFGATVKAQKIRFLCRSKTNCGVREIEVFGSSAAPSTGAMACTVGDYQQFHNASAYDFAEYLPLEYNNDRDKKWPLIIAMHGNAPNRVLNAERNAVITNPEGLILQLKKADFRSRMPAIVISPQTRVQPNPNLGHWFTAPFLRQLLTRIQNSYQIDLDRVYITGLSGGGNGTYEFTLAYPDIPAAIVPIVPPIKPWTKAGYCEALKTMPNWDFRGENDGIGPAPNAIILKDRLDNTCAPAGTPSLMQYTIYPNRGHNIWNDVYQREDLYAWLFQQSKSP